MTTQNHRIVGPTRVAYLDRDDAWHITSRGYAIAYRTKLPSGDIRWTCQATHGYGSASDPETAVQWAGMEGARPEGFRTRREAMREAEEEEARG